MPMQAFMENYWRYVATQERERLRECFAPDACIRWHCTNEQFTVEEFLRANCEYPGAWDGKMERLERCGDTVVTATRIWSGEALSFHVVSFFQFKNGVIAALDEYWGDDGDAPDWRQAMRVGKPIYDDPA